MSDGRRSVSSQRNGSPPGDIGTHDLDFHRFLM
jgi:hypothetical protein